MMLLSSSSSSSPSSILANGSRTRTKTTRSLITGVLAGILNLFVLASPAAAATNGLAKSEIEGRHLAQQLLQLRPAENFANAGVLKFRDSKRKRSQTRIQFEFLVTSTNVVGIYTAKKIRGGISSQTLTIAHNGTAPNGYLLRTDIGDSTRSQNLSGAETMISFADSDFWVADLGLEFLHWPAQKVLKREMRRGQACKVLESTNPEPSTSGYSRVVSWIDNDTLGIVQAEAFDARGKLLKEFAPKEFKKVNGQWQLQEMEIRNVQTGSRTRLEFDLESQ